MGRQPPHASPSRLPPARHFGPSLTQGTYEGSYSWFELGLLRDGKEVEGSRCHLQNNVVGESGWGSRYAGRLREGKVVQRGRRRGSQVTGEARGPEGVGNRGSNGADNRTGDGAGNWTLKGADKGPTGAKRTKSSCELRARWTVHHFEARAGVFLCRMVVQRETGGMCSSGCFVTPAAYASNTCGHWAAGCAVDIACWTWGSR